MSSPSPPASLPAASPSSPAIYMVGGAVRDALLGQPVQDRDWVVVGATPEYMLAQGFTPVGKDFPVFLHPQTHEEYALARTERKSGHGYKGFTIYAAPQVTLEEDLARRDLTINAIAARTEADGRTTYIDPFGGRADLAAKVLRHVGPAFAEDPLRILRLARFAARLADFRIADETLALARQMVDAGEVAHLVPERVWQEIARGLMEPAPGRMLLTLRDCGALAVVLPEIDNLWQQSASGFAHAGEHALHMLRLAGKNDGESDKPNDCSAVDSAEHSTDPANPNNPTENSGETCGPAPLAVRYACLVHPLDAAARDACARRLKIPADVRELADLAASQAPALRALEQRITQGFRQEGRTHNAQGHTAGAAAQSAPGAARALAEDVVAFFERCDAWRRPQRFVRALQVCALAAEPADAESAASAPSNARAANMANPANTANTANTVAIPAAHRTLLHALQVAQAVDTAAIAQTAAREGLRGPEIGQRIQQARAQAVESSVLNYQSIDQ